MAFWLNPRLVSDGATISDFSATTEPYSWLFRSIDIAAGTLLILTAVVAYLHLRPKQFFTRLLISLAAVLGIANIFDAALKLPCTSLDSVCNATVKLSPQHPSLPSHAYSSTIIGICFLAMPALSLLLARTIKARPWLKFAAYISLTATGVFMLLLLTSVFRTGHAINYAVEFSQYIQMVLFAVWFVMLFWRRWGNTSLANPAVK